MLSVLRLLTQKHEEPFDVNIVANDAVSLVIALFLTNTKPVWRIAFLATWNDNNKNDSNDEVINPFRPNSAAASRTIHFGMHLKKK
jgi:hypothetical protein